MIFFFPLYSNFSATGNLINEKFKDKVGVEILGTGCKGGTTLIFQGHLQLVRSEYLYYCSMKNVQQEMTGSALFQSRWWLV